MGAEPAQGASRRLVRLLAGHFLLLLLLSTIASAKPQAPAGPLAEPAAESLNLQSFQVELRRIHSALAANPRRPDQIAALEATLPPSWMVETTERKYGVPSEPCVRYWKKRGAILLGRRSVSDRRKNGLRRWRLKSTDTPRTASQAK